MPARCGPCDEPALPSAPGGTPAGFGLCAFGPGWRERSPPTPTVTTGPAVTQPRPVGGDPARADRRHTGATAPRPKWLSSSSVASRPTGVSNDPAQLAGGAPPG